MMDSAQPFKNLEISRDGADLNSVATIGNYVTAAVVTFVTRVDTDQKGA